MHQTDPSKAAILRLKVFELVLTRNVAKFGNMSPFIEASWNDSKWKSRVQSGSLQSFLVNEGHIFEGAEFAPLTLRVSHSGLLFTSQEIGTSVISSEELSSGKSKEWVEVYFEGTSAGKVQVSVCMYEERRSEQSTHTTSYAAVNLKEEYTRKLNELELEKEELEFYKRKYKRKLEKLNQEKRIYQNKVKEIVKKATPKHTEESSSDEIFDIDRMNPNEDDLRSQVDSDLARVKKTHKKRGVTSMRSVAYSQGKLSDIARSMDMAKVPDMRGSKSTSESKVQQERKMMSDWQEVEDIKKRLVCDDELELRLDMSRPFTSPRRAGTPKAYEESLNEQVKGKQYMTGKLVVYD